MCTDLILDLILFESKCLVFFCLGSITLRSGTNSSNVHCVVLNAYLDFCLARPC